MTKSAVHETGGGGVGLIWWAGGPPGEAKLTNVIVTGFGERCNLVRESKMFVKDEAKRTFNCGPSLTQSNVNHQIQAGS